MTAIISVICIYKNYNKSDHPILLLYIKGKILILEYRYKFIPDFFQDLFRQISFCAFIQLPAVMIEIQDIVPFTVFHLFRISLP